MKINLKNTCYPKPILSNLVDDYIDNNFTIDILNQVYDKNGQILTLEIKTSIDNIIIRKLIEEDKISIVLHLEQKTQREASLLKLNDTIKKEINLLQYSTNDPIEVVAVLFCKSDFMLNEKKCLNDIYGLLSDDIFYERGDILGYSNEIEIKLPEDKRIGSIFNVVKDVDNMLNGQPLRVVLDSSSDLIQILMNSEIHEQFVKSYKKEQTFKKILFFSIVQPAILSAFTEMFYSYDDYKERKWCKTLASKVEKKLKKPAEEIFVKENYDLAKVYDYTNYSLGDLFKDSINTCHNYVLDTEVL